MLSKQDLEGFKTFVRQSFPFSSVQFFPLMVPLSFLLSLILSDAILSDSRIPVSEWVLPESSDEDDVLMLYSLRLKRISSDLLMIWFWF